MFNDVQKLFAGSSFYGLSYENVDFWLNSLFLFLSLRFQMKGKYTPREHII